MTRPLGAAVLVGLLGVFFMVGRWSGRSDSHVPAVDPGTAASTRVVARGRLQPTGGVVDVGVPMSDRLDQVLVSEGQLVRKGEKLALLESNADRQADYDLAASQQAEADRRLIAVTAAGQAVLREAEVKKLQAERIDPLDVKAQEARVRLLVEQLNLAKADLARLHTLKLNSVPQPKVDMQQLAVRKGEEELIAARALLEKLNEGLQLNVQAANAGVEAARANLQRYQAEVPKESLAKGLALAKVRLQHTVIGAPSDGTILKVIAHPGEVLGANPILLMGDTQHMQAVAEVYETDVQHVQVGDRAEIVSPALPATLTARVVNVGRMVARNHLHSLDPTQAADLRIVEVKLELDDSRVAARFINLQVTVTIATQQSTESR